MKKYLLPLLALSFSAIHCTKENEKIVVQEKVTQGSMILSGRGIPSAEKGQTGDYYLDLSSSELYGPKTKDGWGTSVLNLKGLKGDKGDKGDNGTNGQNGEPGQNGQPGLTPHIGENGNWWVGNTDLGVKAQGNPGTNGQDGQPGRDGQPGQPGRDGQNGQPGRDGQNGETPRIGDNGNWWIGNEDTGKPARGAQGPQGNPGTNGQNGQPGRDGQNGHTPHIGKNGNWWVGDQDTGKPARGAQGPQGSQGNPGQQGAQGNPGRDGQPGADGSKILAGNGTPQATDGNIGDYFIDKAAKIFYGPKTASGWPTTGISLVANQIVTTDYELSPDGKTLVKWLNGKTRYIDMNADPKLKLVEKIGINAFNAQTNNLTYQLATIVIGERVRGIEKFAFAQCKKLKEVEIPEGITKIESGTFSNCYNLSSVILPESLTEVGNGSFANCLKLSTIILPKNVNNIGNNAFKNCPNLHSIVLENKTAFQIKPLQFGTDNNLQNIFVPKGTKSAYEALITETTYKAKLKEIGI
ncbi:leucine-rich repeat protein [Capnocytophaga gingivalis]